MNAWLRVPLRVSGIVAWGVACYVVCLIGLAATIGSPRGRMRWQRAMTQSWARGLRRLLGIRVTVRGPVPAAPFLMVTNHLGYIDIVVLGAELGCTFVARRDVRSWPGLGLLARSVNTIFIHREVKRDVVPTTRRMEEALERGAGIVLFAEGTSTNGADVNPMKPALLDLAARNGIPVRYGSVSYRTAPDDPPADRAVCWWGDMEFLGHLMALCRLSGFDADVTYGNASIRSTDRKTLARALHDAVRAQFTPVVTAK